MEQAKEHNEDSGVRRWTRWHTCHPAKRRVALVLEILRGDTTSAESARKHGLTVVEIEDWRDRFLSGAENALKGKPLDDEALREAEVKKLKQKIGELVCKGANAVMDIDIIKEGKKIASGDFSSAKPYMPNPIGRQSSVLGQNASATSSHRLSWHLSAPCLPHTRYNALSTVSRCGRGTGGAR